MKTESEIKFDQVIKEGFHEILKPLGFKKKANNFYLELDSIGQIINIQKSLYGNKRNISYTMNTGIFVPEFWLVFYNYSGKGLPNYPTEPECLFRKRIGELRYRNDMWYEIHDETDEQQIIAEMRKNLSDYILPYFERLNTRTKILHELDTDVTVRPLSKLIVYAEFQQLEKAKAIYEWLLKNEKNSKFLETVRAFGEKYKL